MNELAVCVPHVHYHRGQHIVGVLQIQQWQSAEYPVHDSSQLIASFNSDDWMDGIDTPWILNIPTAKNLLVLDLEAMETCDVCK
ncbi:hypothetical protein NPIL_659911 [Nephila pilipes]|uniref:Uncharacterized protein n=1 Tax=Nephila pilipes TaxID=299642 RepID=A0A8X6N797_NEPPI|nr:hypothetical protein NPIL_659911 [Nephila pilipes]